MDMAALSSTKRYVISVLGISPKATSYHSPGSWKDVHGDNLQNQQIDTEYTPYAVHVLSKATRSFVICTEEAAKIFDEMQKNDKHGHTFVKGLMNAHMSSADFVMVGKEDGNIADVFGLIDTIVSKNNAADVEWLFDITGGFRSISFTVIAVLEYLSVLIDLRVYDICYAQLGTPTKIESVKIQRTYILWARATEAFVRYGHADQLIELFAQLPLEQGGATDYLNTISNMVDALYTAKFADLSDAAGNLLSMLQAVRNKPFFLGEYEPFTKFLQHIIKEYQVFVMQDNDDAELKRLSHIINWYLNHRMWAQAIIAAHETLISVAKHYVGNETETCNKWENVGIGSFTNADNTDLYVLWVDPQDNPVHQQKMAHIYYIDNSPFNGGYNRGDIMNGIKDEQLRRSVSDIVSKLIKQSNVRNHYPADDQSRYQYFERWCKEQKTMCRVIEQFFTSDNHQSINEIIRLLQSMRLGSQSKWEKKIAELYHPPLKSYAASSKDLSDLEISPKEYEPRLIALFTQSMRHLFVARQQILVNVPESVALYSIGNEIRKARNGVSHMNGVADIYTIQKLCERLLTVMDSFAQNTTPSST